VTTQRPIDFLHVGPERHGVTRFGRALEEATASLTAVAGRRLEIGGGTTSPLWPGRASADRVCQLQFTDHLYGDRPDRALATVLDVVRAAGDAVVVVTLHDVPAGLSDPAPRGRQRAAAYRTLADAVRVVTCSTHELTRLRRCGYEGPADVIPLPIPTMASPHRQRGAVSFRSASPPNATVSFSPGRVTGDDAERAGAASIGVLGFVYPGKGQLDVLRACTGLGRPVRFVNLGGAAPRHEDLVDQLRREAAAAGLRCRVTGWIPDEQLGGELAAVDVPVVAHPTPSASASAATWLAAGRRPLVRDSRYARELDAACPGALQRYAPGPAGLRAALASALDDPASTYHRGVPAWLSPASIARRYLEVYRR
jgi:glycosyltransferase involved in cell wall biosynthesis